MPHFCEFCGTMHSAASCYHPGQVRLQEAITRAETAEAQVAALHQQITAKVDEWKDRYTVTGEYMGSESRDVFAHCIDELAAIIGMS